MQTIKAVFFEPVGALAEFSAEEFNDVALRVFEAKEPLDGSGSEAYWQMLDLMEQAGQSLLPPMARVVETLEVQAVGRAQLYDDVVPALAELTRMQITVGIASSLSGAAVSRFLERFSLGEYFAAVWSRDNAGGIKAAPLAAAIAGAALEPQHVMALVDTTASLQTAKQVGANAILMINDYEEGRRLAMQAPSGAVVSLHELPDAIRLIAAAPKGPALRP